MQANSLENLKNGKRFGEGQPTNLDGWSNIGFLLQHRLGSYPSNVRRSGCG